MTSLWRHFWSNYDTLDLKILTQCVKLLGERVRQVWWWYLHWFRRYGKKMRRGLEIALISGLYYVVTPHLKTQLNCIMVDRIHVFHISVVAGVMPPVELAWCRRWSWHDVSGGAGMMSQACGVRSALGRLPRGATVVSQQLLVHDRDEIEKAKSDDLSDFS